MTTTHDDPLTAALRQVGPAGADAVHRFLMALPDGAAILGGGKIIGPRLVAAEVKRAGHAIARGEMSAP